MASPRYLAKFANAAGEFFATALAWPAPSAPALPASWWQVLRLHSHVDISLRLSAGTPPRVVLILTADAANTLQTLLNALAMIATINGLEQAIDAAAFDVMTRPTFPASHLRVNHEGYHYNGQPLGCDFRLYATWLGQGLSAGLAYQVTLRSHQPDPEQERRVRKYLAWLKMEQPYTPPVRKMLDILSHRLLTPGWLADEYLLFNDTALGADWQTRIQTHFSETTGRIGFREAPIECGDFSDWLSIGCHTARDGGAPTAVPVQGACMFSEDEVLWLAGQNLATQGLNKTTVMPDIFVSYASGDFTVADKTRQHLENRGWHCWIAPRDINTSGLPYTEAIPRAIQQVRAIVVLLSPSANLSVHIPRELDLALARKLPIIPLRIIDLTPIGQLEYLLRTCQWLDVFGRDYREAMTELECRLHSLGV